MKKDSPFIKMFFLPFIDLWDLLQYTWAANKMLDAKYAQEKVRI
jgi:hypothetical protein